MQWERQYSRLRRPRQRSLALDEEAILKQLQGGPVPVESFAIDVADFRDWRRRADYERLHPRYYYWNLEEKTLEHYVAAQLLQLKKDQVYLDVAAEQGVAAQVYERLYGVRPLVQDLAYEPGMHGNRIGGDAANLPLEDASVDAIALHCAFEHFENDSDSRLIGELGRVLKPGGRAVIIPLYLCQFPACLTDPRLSVPGGVHFDEGAVLIALRTWPNRHGRFYDGKSLVERVWRHCRGLEMKVLVCGNYGEVGPGCYLRYVAFFQKNA